MSISAKRLLNEPLTGINLSNITEGEIDRTQGWTGSIQGFMDNQKITITSPKDGLPWQLIVGTTSIDIHEMTRTTGIYTPQIFKSQIQMSKVNNVFGSVYTS